MGDGAGGLQQRDKYACESAASGGGGGGGEFTLQLVPRVGYVSVFPLLLRLVPHGSLKLAALLALLDEHLLSPHGLRSLAPADLLYRRPNAPGDAPYWRGAIWCDARHTPVTSHLVVICFEINRSVRPRRTANRRLRSTTTAAATATMAPCAALAATLARPLPRARAPRDVRAVRSTCCLAASSDGAARARKGRTRRKAPPRERLFSRAQERPREPSNGKPRCRAMASRVHTHTHVKDFPTRSH